MLYVPQTAWVSAKCAPITPTNGAAVFTAVGDLELHALIGEVTTVFDAAATTIQYSITNANGTAPISAATASLSAKAKGTTIAMQMGALNNAPVISSNGAGANVTPWGAVWIPDGSTVSIVVANPQTTGKMSFYAIYTAHDAGSSMIPAA